MKRVVIKIGSSNIIEDNKLNFNKLIDIGKQIRYLRKQNIEVILVTSGAVAMAREKFNDFSGNINIRKKQALSAIGQPYLMRKYKEAFVQSGIDIAQILLTKDDLYDRKRYINARETIWEIMNYGIIPIVNENDTISTDEIKIGDNDNLSAMVAAATDADYLVILSDVDGLYDKNPKKYSDAKLINIVKQITNEIENSAGEPGSNVGTGGMITKIEAAKYATKFGIEVYIVNGNNIDNISNSIINNNVGTRFLSKPRKNGKRKLWIGYGIKSKGSIYIDSGAYEAIQSGKSLLPSGITKIDGKFHIGDSVKIINNDNKEIARGLSNYDFDDIDKIKQRNSCDIESILGYRYSDEIIHRDNMVLIKQA